MHLHNDPDYKVDQPSSTEHSLISDSEFTLMANDPFLLFGQWLDLAHSSEVNDANAMAIATVDRDGLPNVRMVLLKDYDQAGFVFYTNTESQKGEELLMSGKAAAVLHWKSLRRQVRFRGRVTAVTDEEADKYFSSRSRQSRIGAWASHQSKPLASRQSLLEAVDSQTIRFGTGSIPRPPHWHGFRVDPVSIEFWMDKPFRLHDRLVFKRDQPTDSWITEKLFP